MGTAERMIQCGSITWELGKRTYIMGILNLTPDSFSDGGSYDSLGAAVRRAQQMEAEGADIIDIGGESTRPGAEPVSLDEELARVIPVIEALQGKINVPISIDTYKAETARQALEAGAQIINDIWGFRKDPHMASVAAQFACPVILMHNRVQIDYTDLIADMISDLQESIAIAERAGVARERIILDPGIGFAKTFEHNLQVMNQLDEICQIGYPVILGTSRKKFIRAVLDSTADDVLEGTAATVALGIARGCDFIRVHDVKFMRRVAMMTDAMARLR